MEDFDFRMGAELKKALSLKGENVRGITSDAEKNAPKGQAQGSSFSRKIDVMHCIHYAAGRIVDDVAARLSAALSQEHSTNSLIRHCTPESSTGNRDQLTNI